MLVQAPQSPQDDPRGPKTPSKSPKKHPQEAPTRPQDAPLRPSGGSLGAILGDLGAILVHLGVLLVFSWDILGFDVFTAVVWRSRLRHVGAILSLSALVWRSRCTPGPPENVEKSMKSKGFCRLFQNLGPGIQNLPRGPMRAQDTLKESQETPPRGAKTTPRRSSEASWGLSWGHLGRSWGNLESQCLHAKPRRRFHILEFGTLGVFTSGRTQTLHSDTCQFFNILHACKHANS